MNTVTLRPRNSIIFIFDPSHLSIEVPTYVAGKLVAANPTCVSIGTLSEMDGETTIMLTDSIDGLIVGELVFDGVLLAPGDEVSIFSSENDRLLTLALNASRARVRIFANDFSEPNDIVVLAEPDESL